MWEQYYFILVTDSRIVSGMDKATATHINKI